MPRFTSCVFLSALTLTGLLCRPGSAADAPANIAATLKGHGEIVYAIVFSPDGKYVATGSFDKTVRVWETATGKESKSFGGPTGHQNLVLSVAFSPDGKMLASGSQDNTARVWDMPGSAGGSLRTFAHAAAISSLALSPVGKILAGAGKDGTVRLWNAADGKTVFDLKGHSGPVLGVAFAPDGKLLASAGSDRSLRFWNVADGKPAGEIQAHQGAATSVLFSPANAAVVVSAGADGLLKSWKLPVGAPRQLAGKAEAAAAITLSANGTHVVLAGPNVRILNYATGQPVRTLKGNAAALEAVAISPNEAWIAAGSADQRLLVWNAATGALLSQPLTPAAAIRALAFHPQNNQLLTGGADGALKLWPIPLTLGTETPVATAAHAGGVGSVAFHANGTQVLSGGADKTVKLWNIAGGKEPLKAGQAFAPLEAAVRAVAFHPNGTHVAGAGGKVVKLWNIADGKEVLSLSHAAEVTSLAFSFDKTKLVTGGADRVVHVWDLATGKELDTTKLAGAARTVLFHSTSGSVVSLADDASVSAFSPALQRVLPATKGPVRALAITPVGTHVLAVGDDRQIKLWNLATGANERTLATPEGAVTALAVSRNGALVAAGSGDQSVRILNFADGKQLGLVKATGPVLGLAFSPNNQLLAAACGNRALMAWNVAYTPGQAVPADFGKLLRSTMHEAAATDVVFSPDSTQYYSSGDDRSVRAWSLGGGQATSRSFAHPALVDAVAFNPAGTLLATGCHDGNLRIWELAKGQPKVIAAHLKPAVAPIYCVAWSPDGKQVVTGSFDRTLKLWDATSGNMVREFKAFKEKEFDKGHHDGVFCAAFSPDGKTLATGGSDRSVKLWNVADGAVIREFANPNLKRPPNPLPGPVESHPGWVYGVRFTADGQRLVSAGNAPGNQGYLAVWNAADGKLISGAEFPLGPFYSVALSPDGRLAGVACGPRGGQAEANAYLLKMPSGK